MIEQQQQKRLSSDAMARLTMQLREMDRRVQAQDFLPGSGIALTAIPPCARGVVAAACRATLKDRPVASKEKSSL